MTLFVNPSIIRDAQDGDLVALGMIARQVEPFIVRQLKRYPVSAEDRQDLLQIVLMRLSSKIGSFRGDASFATWLFRVTANEALMLMRSNRRHSGRLVDGPLEDDRTGASGENQDSVIDVAATAERDARVLDALTEIPEPYKNVVVAHYLLDLDLHQIARRFGITESAVRSRLHRARLRLRAKLVPESDFALEQ